MKYRQKVRRKRRVYNYVIDSTRGSCYRRPTSYSWVYYGESFRYRYDPVPGTGKGKNSVHPYVRCMRTTQERKIGFAHYKYVRGKRRPNSLPNAWDDIWHARRTRGWKRTKKRRQWMVKGDKLFSKNCWPN